MTKCECLAGCPFFNDRMRKMDALAESIKDHYCLKNFSGCARHLVFKALGRENVPIDLYPTEVERARRIIEGAAVLETSPTDESTTD